LATATLQQNRFSAAAEKNQQGNQETSAGSEDADDSSDHRETDEHIYCRAPQGSKARKPAGPSTVRYYPGSWKTVLDRSKNRFARHVFLNQGFPARTPDLHIARDILYEEIAKGKAEKLTLDNGKPPDYISIECLLIQSVFVAYEQTREMDVLVNNSLHLYLWF